MLTRCLSLALTRNSRGGSKHPLYFASNTQIYGNKPRFKINRIYTFYLIGFNAKSDANCQQVRGLKSDKSHPAPELYGAQVGSDRVREQSLSLCPGNIWSALPATSLPPPPTPAVMSDRRGPPQNMDNVYSNRLSALVTDHRVQFLLLSNNNATCNQIN